MILAMVAATATTTFAQGDALKTILKSKDYAEAENLLKANLSSFSAEQKAKAYNKLVDLAMDKYDHEEGIMNTNQVKAQMGQTGGEAFDTAGMYTAANNALKSGIECDKYDNMPNDKGKTAPKFHKSNQSRLYKVRLGLINGGQYAAEKGDSKGALDNYSMYVESAKAPLFADYDNSQMPDQWLGEVARVAAVYSYQANDFENANKYCDVALADTASHKDALGLKMYLLQANLKNHEDSLACLKNLKDYYAKDNDEQVFNAIANMYQSLGMDKEQLEFLKERLAVDPNNFTVWALKGQNEMNSQQWDDALADFKKAIEIDGTKSIVYTYIGFIYNSKAQELASKSNNPAATKGEQDALYTESLKYLEKAREIDPDRKGSNWTYPLYQCYYNLYGEADAKTKEIEALIKQ